MGAWREIYLARVLDATEPRGLRRTVGPADAAGFAGGGVSGLDRGRANDCTREAGIERIVPVNPSSAGDLQADAKHAQADGRA